MAERREKILFLITKAHPYGGAQRYVFDLATTLRDRYEVVVALGGEGRLLETLHSNQIRMIPLPNLRRDIRIKDELRSFFDTYRMLRKERPDILHLNSSKAGGLGALAGRLAGVKKIVFTAHAWAWNEDRGALSRITIIILHWLTVMLAHRTICVSHAIYDQMARYPFMSKRMRVVHLGIMPPPSVDRLHAREYLGARAPALNDAKDAFWLGIVGELHPVKGHHYALEAFKALEREHSDLHLVIVGNGELREALETEAADMERVHFVGYVDDAGALMSAFDILLVPSLSEAFGYVVAEAGAAHIPIIASRVGGIPEIIEDDSGILVPPKDVTALAGALRTLLADETKRTRMALALQTRIRSYFTRERMVTETEDVYELMG